MTAGIGVGVSVGGISVGRGGGGGVGVAFGAQDVNKNRITNRKHMRLFIFLIPFPCLMDITKLNHFGEYSTERKNLSFGMNTFGGTTILSNTLLVNGNFSF